MTVDSIWTMIVIDLSNHWLSEIFKIAVIDFLNMLLLILHYLYSSRYFYQNACGGFNKVTDFFSYSWLLTTDFVYSGGKDSTYNMIECVRHGHELVALANLHPKQDIGKND